ncbi:MAG TPA: translation elongation factor Ts [Steroidobacteraceae bacterium]|nr:translation elongation factor Ts [Steroidobacteraceae bacterium]
MNITADAVKRLRERTGAGMMECKRALVETAGDLDAAADLMRKTGLAKADKKAQRVAAEGSIAIERSALGAAIVEVNSETDFVARSEEFQGFARDLARLALARSPSDLTALLGLREHGEPMEERRRALIAKIGENISVRRFERLTAPTALGAYLHGTRIGALVALRGGSEELARDLAMHVAALNPAYLDAESVPAQVLDRERAIIGEQTRGENKPPQIIAKMVEGRLRKYLAEITLAGQPFVKDPETTVANLLKKSAAAVSGYVRYEVGAGIEKRRDDFAGEVMAQVQAQSKDDGGHGGGGGARRH